MGLIRRNATKVRYDGVYPIYSRDGSLHPQTRTTGFCFHQNCWRTLELSVELRNGCRGMREKKTQIGKLEELPELGTVDLRILNLVLRSFGVSKVQDVVDCKSRSASMCNDKANPGPSVGYRGA
jgi:hypothetical protein